MPATLIAIEGLDGSGKQTQTALLNEDLIARGLNTASISFPCYGEPSAVLVEDYLQGGFGEHADDVNAYAASSFFAMDRLVSYLKYWRTLYMGKDVLIADRYTTSNLIYQCAKLPPEAWSSFAEWLADYEFEKLALPRPNKVIYLRLDLATSQHLLEKRYGGDSNKRDVHERDLGYLKRSRCAAEWCCEKMGWTAVECSADGVLRDKKDIHAEVMAVLGMDVTTSGDVIANG